MEDALDELRAAVADAQVGLGRVVVSERETPIVSKSGVKWKWVRGRGKWQCDRTLR
jgi:hypothetical protein